MVIPLEDDWPCEVPGCVALAVERGKCSVHRYLAKLPYETRCAICSRPIKAGIWHVHAGDERKHFPRCPPAKPPAAEGGA